MKKIMIIFGTRPEAIKMALTSDRELFEIFENKDIGQNLDEIIIRSLNIKKSVVEQDEKETGLRKILNYGHTLGHAFESLNFSTLYHGECVALGMLYMCSDGVKSRLLPVLERLNLPTAISCNKQDALAVLKHDKKADAEHLSCIYVDTVGKFRIKNAKPEVLIELL